MIVHVSALFYIHPIYNSYYTFIKSCHLMRIVNTAYTYNRISGQNFPRITQVSYYTAYDHRKIFFLLLAFIVRERSIAYLNQITIHNNTRTQQLKCSTGMPQGQACTRKYEIRLNSALHIQTNFTRAHRL